DEDGHVHALSPGAATITATTEAGAYQSRSIISVLPAGTATNQNGEFDDGMSGWVVYDWTGPNQGNGGNEFSVVQGAGLSGDNALHVDIVNDNAEGWTLQLRQALNFRLEVGRTYEISFMAKAESARQINPLLNASPSNTNYWTGTANLTTSPQTFIYKYTCTNPNVENEESFAFKFYLAKGVESDIWIDNIVVRDLSGGGTNPVLGGRIEAENYDAQSGLSVSGGALGSCDQNDWARYDDIDLTGVKELRVHLAAPGSVGNMEVRLGSTAGTLVARMPTVNTGGWTTFKSFTVPVSETTGVHDLFIVFKDRPSGGIMNVDWLEFLGESPAVPVTAVSIVEESASVQVGQTLRLTKIFTPTDPAPTNQVVVWASDDTDVVVVNANGDATGIEEGTATITVTTEDGAFSDQVVVTVSESGAGTYYATRLSGSPTERYGLAKSLSVMPGDVVDIEVFVKYIDPDQQNWTPLLNNLVAAISIPSGGILVDGGLPGSLGNETLPFTPIDNDTQAGGAPKAYLNYILTDRDFVPVEMGSKPVTSAAREYGQNGTHERLFFDDIVVRE